MLSTADTNHKGENPNRSHFFPEEQLFTANNIMTGRLVFLLLCLVLQAASQVVVTRSAMDEADEVLTTKVRNLGSRIVGGVKADPKRHPYFTQLMITFASSTTVVTGNCGGTLIASDVVLTAAHCLTADSSSVVYNIRTWVNSTSIYDSPYEYYRTASRYLIHPFYDDYNTVNDIALIFLDSRVTGVTLAKISTTANAPAVGTAMTAIGLGLLKSSPETKATYLMSVSINNLNPAACSAYFRYGFKSVNQICAGGAKGTCNGDSGGPLVVHGASASTDLLVGVASYGTSAGCGLYPSAWTRVSKYAAWITTNICKFSKFKPSTCA